MLDFQTDLLGAQLDQSWNLLSSLEPGTPEVNALFMELKQVNHHGMHVIFWCICTACKPNEYIQVHTLKHFHWLQISLVSNEFSGPEKTCAGHRLAGYAWQRL